jgi:hypothetical protein
MRIFFDVDYTILSADYKLRNGTRETFEQLVADGHEIHVWSGEGKRYKVLRDFDLEQYVSGVYEKPIYDYVRRLESLGVEHVPDFVIDDYPEIVSVFGGYHVRDFYSGRDDDDEMEHIYSAITEWASSGESAEKRWRPRHPDFDLMVATNGRRP